MTQEHLNRTTSPALLFGLYIKMERKNQKITQEGLSDRLGVDVRTVRYWESNGVYDIERIQDILDALGKTFSDTGIFK